ncbi:LacI family DNA-binding transcriptional regulator [Heliobacterium chlorum]|uniref:LacI family DNA-binding transcriptional regulator n=1 Tax=Heliobacterium chlorum TaxID=2698 RepID=A0ABR7T1G2_HELCL|nr:LacI family DNA-binding transcriptional regulator [Heliobacterium chlorum]MBC9784623.1 LacI family DNA-binding transcriptional regulator [Heliobacterium chlorum]
MATIKDVAKLAGVSVSTVSRVLNGSGYVDKTTEERVLSSIRSLNYQPNRIARSLVTRKTKTIGLILPDITNPFFPEVVRGAEDEAHKRGYNIILCNSDWDEEKEQVYLSVLQQQCVDGVILVGTKLSESYLVSIAATFPPIVVIDRTIALDMHSISSNNIQGAYAATGHLLAQGCRIIGHISGPEQSVSARQRMQGYRQALDEAGIPFLPELVVGGDYRMTTGKAAAAELLRRSPQLEGIFCANDLMAIGALEQLREASFRVPRDVAVVGYDGIAMSRYVYPPLTTVVQPTYRMGERAIQLLFDSIERNQPEFQHIELEPLLEIRKSSTRRACDENASRSRHR